MGSQALILVGKIYKCFNYIHPIFLKLGITYIFQKKFQISSKFALGVGEKSK